MIFIGLSNAWNKFGVFCESCKKFKPTFDTQGSSQTGEEDKRVFQLFLFNAESVRPSAARRSQIRFSICMVKRVVTSGMDTFP